MNKLDIDNSKNILSRLLRKNTSSKSFQTDERRDLKVFFAQDSLKRSASLHRLQGFQNFFLICTLVSFILIAYVRIPLIIRCLTRCDFSC